MVTNRYHVYELRIRGEASDLVRAAFDEVELTEESGQTVLRTGWADIAVLYGLVGRLESLGLVLLEVKAVESPHASGRSV